MKIVYNLPVYNLPVYSKLYTRVHNSKSVQLPCGFYSHLDGMT